LLESKLRDGDSSAFNDPATVPYWNKLRASALPVRDFQPFSATGALRPVPTSLSFGQVGQAFSENRTMTETPLQPTMTERAIDSATDVSRTITDASAGLRAAVDRLSEAIATARQPGGPLSTLSAITREAPLASLFVAFLFGVAVARRRG
jgi:hypothetical protein